MKRFLWWLISPAMLRRYVLGIVILATVIALFYAEENWRGGRAWARVKAEWEAKGESFEAARLIPPAVVDEENFCAIQLLDFKRLEMVKKVKALDFRKVYAEAKGPRPPSQSWTAGCAVDYSAWKEYLASDPKFPADLKTRPPAEALYLMCRRLQEAEWAELVVATERPQARFPVDYDFQPLLATPLPHISGALTLFTAVSNRTAFALASGHSNEFQENIKISCKLQQALAQEPLLICHLVNTAGMQLMLQPIWEGMADRRFSPQDLVFLQESLSRVDLLKSYRQAIRGEFVCLFPQLIDYLKKADFKTLSSFPSQLMGGGSSQSSITTGLLLWLIPNGWFDQNRAAAVEYFYGFMVPAADPEQHRVFPAKIEEMEKKLATEFTIKPTRVMVRLTVPAMMGALSRTAFQQANLDLARIACNLEVYFLKNHSYPDSLNELGLALPHDVVSGQPYHYQKTSQGRYRLWSVGWNGQDEGGKRVFKEKSPERIEEAQGDWVWDYPEK